MPRRRAASIVSHASTRIEESDLEDDGADHYHDHDHDPNQDQDHEHEHEQHSGSGKTARGGPKTKTSLRKNASTSTNASTHNTRSRDKHTVDSEEEPEVEEMIEPTPSMPSGADRGGAAAGRRNVGNGNETGNAHDGESQRPPASQVVRDDDDANTFRILLATDNHIGYAERDPIRGQDSLNTFREILSIARAQNVDVVLLAGDLFHENRPSRECMTAVMGMLREFAMGDKPVQVELLSDPMEGHAAGFSFPAVNYEDPNLNVAIPVFSIHGNHDDPQGTGPSGALCALDTLSVAGVINYFGKVHLAADEDAGDPTSDGIQIKPVLLQKGATRLAMYGIGNVRDTRMHYELRSNRVRMFQPAEEEEEGENRFFNLLLIHQNRVKHGPQNSVPEGMFDDSVDLVIWGHEHDCRIEPEPVAGKRYYITQPGSSVATSLAHGEAIQKKVGLLSIQKDRFNIEPIVLKTVRPFKIGEVVLAEEAEDPESGLDLQQRDTVTAFLKAKVEELIKEAEEEWIEQGHDAGEKMMLPLIRLKVETSSVKELMNAPRFGQQFSGRIANPKDVLQYYRKKVPITKKDKVKADAPDFEEPGADDGLIGEYGAEGVSKIRMNELVNEYLKAQNLAVLESGMMEDALHRYIDKDDTDAIRDFVKDTLNHHVNADKAKYAAGELDVDNPEALKAHFARSNDKFAASYDGASRPAGPKGKGKKKKSSAASDDSMLSDDDLMEVEESDASSQTSKRGKRKNAAAVRKTVAAASQSRGKKATTPLFDDDDDDEDESEEEEFVPRAQRGKPSTAAKRAPAKKVTRMGGTGAKQSQLSFAPSQNLSGKVGKAPVKNIATIDISDDSD